MALDSAKQPELEQRGHQPIGGADAPDPWGVRRAENLLTSLEGVLSARVVTTPLGEVSEVHVLAQAGLSPKQVVRNVESALLAQLGLKVDHRKISVAQTADVKPIEALEKDTVRELVLQRAVLFEDLQVLPGSRPHRIGLTVSLSYNGIRETAAEPGRGSGTGYHHRVGPVAGRFVRGAGGCQDSGCFRPAVCLRGGAGSGWAGNVTVDRNGRDSGERRAGGGVRRARRHQSVDRAAPAALDNFLVVGSRGEGGGGCAGWGARWAGMVTTM